MSIDQTTCEPTAAELRTKLARAEALVIQQERTIAELNSKLSAALAELTEARAERRETPVERTPETVLRAMLRAYIGECITRETSYFQVHCHSPEGLSADDARERLWGAAEAIRGELAFLLANGGMDTSRDWPEWIGHDYEARMRGERPLDAPPAEV